MNNYEKLTEQPVEGLILKLSIPTIISMLVTTFYNMADTYFVSRMKSTSATGAVGVVFSLMAVIQAFGFFFGHGSGNFISRALGAGDYDKAEKMAATGFFSAIIAGILITVSGLVFLRPLAYLLGATKTIYPYAKDYLSIILVGAPFMCSSLVLNNQLRFQGKASFAMIGITAGAVLNCVLDPLLITAQGIEIIRRKEENKLRQTLARIEELIEEYEVKEIVLGLPKNMNDTLGPRVDLTLEFKEKLERRTGLPVHTWDERLTTVSADRTMMEAGIRRENRKEYVDKIAAVLILQGFLDCRGRKQGEE